MAETKSQNPQVFFGVEHTEKFYLPNTNEEQWIEIKKLSAAKKSDYHNSLGELSELKEVKNEDGTKGYSLVPNPSKVGLMNKKLMEVAVVGYNVYIMNEAGQPELKTGYDSNVWRIIYETMDESIEKSLIDEINKLNPSLQSKKESEKKS